MAIEELVTIGEQLLAILQPVIGSASHICSSLLS